MGKKKDKKQKKTKATFTPIDREELWQKDATFSNAFGKAGADFDVDKSRPLDDTQTDDAADEALLEAIKAIAEVAKSLEDEGVLADMPTERVISASEKALEEAKYTIELNGIKMIADNLDAAVNFIKGIETVKKYNFATMLAGSDKDPNASFEISNVMTPVVLTIKL